MPSPTRRRPTRLAAGAFLTLLALAALAPGSARAAGCAHDSARNAHFEGLIRAGAMSESPAGAISAPEATPARPPVCSGPHCSRGPAAPPPSPWVVPAAHDSWALLASVLKTDGSRSRPLPPESAPMPTSPRGPSVFHPPRIASR